MFSQKQKNKLTPESYQLEASSGFTLIEILLVTFIAGLVFVAIYMLYAMTIKQDVESRYEIIASNLAQEGIEIIRNRRDEEILAGNAIDDAWSIGSDCHPDYQSTAAPGFGRCVTTIGPHVGWNGTNYYNCPGGSCGVANATPFERVCHIEEDDLDVDGSDDTLIVTCTVSWDSFVNPLIARDVEVTSVLTDWDAD